MKKTIILIAFLLAAKGAIGQTTLTPNISLQIPSYQQTNWQVPLNFDLNLLDQVLGGVQTLTIGSATPAVNVSPVFVTANTSAVTVTNLLGGFFGQKITISCGSGDTFTMFANSANIKLVTSPWSCASFSSLGLINLSGVWTETGRAGGSAGTIFYQTVQNASGVGQTQRPTVEFTGTAVASVTDDSANGRTVVTLTASAGSGVTLQTNTVNNSSQTALNLLNSAATNGLTLTVTNTSGGNVQLGLSGTLNDAGLTSAYSGVGSCTANQFVNSTSRNASPGCAQPGFSNLSGTATDSQLASAYSGVGACASHNWASTLNRNAAPTCTQPAFSDLSGNISTSQMNSGTGASSSTFWRGDGTWAASGSGVSEAALVFCTGTTCTTGTAFAESGSGTGSGLETILTNAHTIIRFTYNLSQSPAGCGTSPLIGVRDRTSSTTLTSASILNGATVGFIDSGALSIATTAGDKLMVGIITGSTGCSTQPLISNVAMVYQ